MSKYTGTCDFYDEIYMSGRGFDDFKGTKVMLDDKEIKYENELDLAPYWTYVIGFSYHRKDKPEDSVVHLSSKKEMWSFMREEFNRETSELKRKLNIE